TRVGSYETIQRFNLSLLGLQQPSLQAFFTLAQLFLKLHGFFCLFPCFRWLLAICHRFYPPQQKANALLFALCLFARPGIHYTSSFQNCGNSPAHHQLKAIEDTAYLKRMQTMLAYVVARKLSLLFQTV